jgi:pyruvate dehydrogenase E2 component (dihydrolipoamide acetyltransferase)
VPREVYLVKVGMTMTEGMVTEWYVNDGQKVSRGDMVYALETEKVNLDVDAEISGTLKHVAEIGVAMEPGDIVGYIFEDGETITEVRNTGRAQSQDNSSGEIDKSAKPTPTPTPTPTPAPTNAGPSDGRLKASPAARRLAIKLGIDLARVSGSGPGGRIIETDLQNATSLPAPSTGAAIRISPLARRMAEQKGVDVSTLSGSGPGGRIVQADIELAAADNGVAVPSENQKLTQSSSGNSTIPLRGMRKTIASRMLSSLQTSAQLTMNKEAQIGEAVKLRESLIAEWKDEDIRPTYTDLVIKAVAKALPKHPIMNSIFGPESISLIEDIHIGFAVALSEGLVVPVIRHADRLSIKEIAAESARLAQAARAGTLGMDDYAGGTFTITALGMYGVDSFTPIINEPQVGILGVNRIYDGIEWKGEVPVKDKKMNLSLTWDHRVVDGAPAAEFLVEVCELLAQPIRLLV